MKKISIYLFFLFFLTDKAFASLVFVESKCFFFKKYNYWKNLNTGIIEKHYVGLCDQGPLGFIPYFQSNPAPAVVILVLLFFFSMKIIFKQKTPEEIKKQKKAEKKELQYYKKLDKEEEKKRLQEEKRLAKEERKIDKEVSSSDLGASLKRLKKMYKDGHLSKVEFEKAKNKLLK